MIHGDSPLLKIILFNLIDLNIPLIPLERVKSLSNYGHEAVLDVIVDPHVGLDEVTELLDNLIRVFFEESLETAEGLELVEVLLKLSIEVCEDIQVLLKNRDGRVETLLAGDTARMLQVVVLEGESLHKPRDLVLVVSTNCLLLLLDCLCDLRIEVLLLQINQVL